MDNSYTNTVHVVVHNFALGINAWVPIIDTHYNYIWYILAHLSNQFKRLNMTILSPIGIPHFSSPLQESFKSYDHYCKMANVSLVDSIQVLICQLQVFLYTRLLPRICNLALRKTHLSNMAIAFQLLAKIQ